MVLLVDAGSLVCSGAAMDLNATEHTFGINAYWNIRDVPGKPKTNYNTRLAQGKYTGFANPIHRVMGIYDDTGRAYTQDLASNGYYFVTGSMLAGMMMAGSMFALISNKITYSEFGSGSMVYVAPKSYNIIRTATSDKGAGGVGYIIDYSLELQEVKV